MWNLVQFRAPQREVLAKKATSHGRPVKLRTQLRERESIFPETTAQNFLGELREGLRQRRMYHLSPLVQKELIASVLERNTGSWFSLLRVKIVSGQLEWNLAVHLFFLSSTAESISRTTKLDATGKPRLWEKTASLKLRSAGELDQIENKQLLCTPHLEQTPWEPPSTANLDGTVLRGTFSGTLAVNAIPADPIHRGRRWLPITLCQWSRVQLLLLPGPRGVCRPSSFSVVRGW